MSTFTRHDVVCQLTPQWNDEQTPTPHIRYYCLSETVLNISEWFNLLTYTYLEWGMSQLQ